MNNSANENSVFISSFYVWNIKLYMDYKTEIIKNGKKRSFEFSITIS